MGFLDEHPTDLLVLATHGRDGVARWLHGSIAEELSRIAKLPTLFMPPTGRGFVDHTDGTGAVLRAAGNNRRTFGDGWDRFRSLWAAYAPPREAFGSSLAAFRSRWDAMRFLHAPDPFPFRPDASFRVLLVPVPAPLGRHSVLVVPTSEHRGADPVPPGRQSVPAMAISATVGTGFVGYVSTLGYAPAFRPPNT
jgi:hypothetical protein